MMTKQITGVDVAGRSRRLGRSTRQVRCPAVRIGSQSPFTSAVVALLVALVLVGRDQPALGQTQEPAAANPAEPAADNQDVSQRYRFLERYSATDDPTKPELLTQYKVACSETVKITLEKPQGAPELQRSKGLGIYTERVAKLSKGAVTEVVRNFKKIDFKTTMDIPRYKTPLLQGLTVLYLPQGRFLPPQVLSLTPGRQLRPLEYDGIRQQTFLPIVSLILPSKPGRVGDTWPVRREAVFALLGNAPAEEDYAVTAEILEIRKNKEGPTMTAVIEVKGQLVIPEGPCGIWARVHFTFVPTEVAAPTGSRPRDETTKDSAPDSKSAPAPAGRDKGVLDANGYISKISLCKRCPGHCRETMAGSRGTCGVISCSSVEFRLRPEAMVTFWRYPTPHPFPPFRTRGWSTTIPRGGSTSSTPKNCTLRGLTPKEGSTWSSVGLTDRTRSSSV